jgi:sugar/nucleoside kinase (ribokinase family)
MKSDRKVVVLGAAAVDWVARVKEFPAIDGITFADQYQAFAGGSGGNTAEGLARLGYGVRFLGVLGDDEGGQMLLQAFQAAGVDTCGTLIMKGERSAACFIAVDARGQRMIYALGGVALLEKAQQVRSKWLHAASLLYIADAYAEVALASIYGLPPGARVVFSPGGLMVSAGSDYLDPILAKTDVLILNQVEIESLAKETDLEKACRFLLAHGPSVILLTLGSQGVLVAEHGSFRRVPAEVVADVVDTTGAGDAFSTGVLAGMLEDLDWEGCAQLGCKMAAGKIRHFGSRTGLPDRVQIHTWLDARRERSTR